MKKNGVSFLRLKSIQALLAGDRQKAFELLKQVSLEDPSSLDAFLVTGTLMREQKDFSKAARIHSSILERKDLSKDLMDEARFQLAKDYIEAGNCTGALALLENAEAALLPMKAEALQKLGNNLEAVKIYKRCAKTDETAMKKAARCFYAEASKGADSLKHLKEAVKCDPSFFRARLDIAKIYFSEGKKIKGTDELNEALSQSEPFCAEQMTEAEGMFFDAHHMESLFKASAKKIAAASQNIFYYAYAAKHLVKKGDKDRAVKILEDCIQHAGFKVIPTLQYADLTGNTMLRKAFEGRTLYTCENCGADFDTCADSCGVCSALCSVKPS
jgi:lipopolysaccharide biosynthesis regulator YciM